MAAANQELPRPIYRYQIGKVWRYDRPQAGRYREFYQADADILGSYSTDCEVELLLMATEVLLGFDLPEYKLVVKQPKVKYPIDGTITVYDADGKQVAYNDGGSPGANASVSQQFAAAGYAVTTGTPRSSTLWRPASA